MSSTRKEKDYLGAVAVPSRCYYGAQTARAIALYPISGMRMYPEMILALLDVKQATCQANMRLGELTAKQGRTIVRAIARVRDAAKKQDDFFKENFSLDVFQAGAGTSLHMNVNEVVANVGNEMLGGKKGAYAFIHPNDHVNFGQSTNDVYPTAMRIAAYRMLEKYKQSLHVTERSFEKKGKAFASVLKAGRTHLQDALPMRLGDEFSAYAATLRRWYTTAEMSQKELLYIGLGGTAVGSGHTTHPQYRKIVIRELRKITRMSLFPATHMHKAMHSMRPFILVSSTLAGIAIDMGKIINDLRLMASGPRTGLYEITLPEVQPGSSMMPGKVNPSVLEMANMVCFRVIGNNGTVALASGAGQLELNVMMPVIAFSLFESLSIFSNALTLLTENCINGITANKKVCLRYAENTIAFATLLNKSMSYNQIAELVGEAKEQELSIFNIIKKKHLLTDKEIQKLLRAC